LESKPDDMGYKTEVYLQSRSMGTNYDKDTVIKAAGMEDCIKYGLIKLNHTAVRKYLKEHPELADKIEGTMSHTNPFLGSRKNK
jgi:hypothetical protein